MSKPQDGLVSRFVNRPISRFITSHVLLKLPISPNAWTIAICILPVGSGVFLARGDYPGVVAGAALFQIYSVLDGCDGEIARAKNLESKFGERLDYFCDFLASILFVAALGFGISRLNEAIVCATLITANELLLRNGKPKQDFDSDLDQSLYARHRGMIANSGVLNLGERFVWWIMQLTKRDVAILVFLVLALLGRAEWILHLWTAVAGASVILSVIAAIRARHGDRRRS